MSVSIKQAVLSVVSMAACIAASAEDTKVASLPSAPIQQVGDFALLDQNGEFQQLSRYRHKKALVVMSYDASCASDKQAVAAFDQMRKTVGEQDVAYLLLNSKSKQNRAAIRDAAKESGVSFPIMMDTSQLVAESLGLKASGSVIVLGTEKQQVFYKGAASTDATSALQAALTGAVNSTKTAAEKGCAIEFAAKKQHTASVPDYAKTIAPIIEKNCAMCHHEGGIGPFPMNSYTMMKGWSPMIREVLLTKRMPPMQVDPEISHFTNARYMSDSDMQALVHWIDAGSPRGASKDDPLAKIGSSSRTEWQLGKPDFIVKANKHEIPEQGVMDYINDEVQLSFDEDKWVRAVQFIPGQPQVLHHLLTYVTGPKEQFAGGEATNSNVATRFLEGYAPGKTEAMVFPTDTGVFIPKGHKLTMQFHYTTNGKAATDETILGLYFYDKPPKYEYLNRSVSGPVKIPANTRDVKTAGTLKFQEDVVVYGLRAHMHFRGQDMKFSATLPDGTNKELLSVPNYSYAWQPTYQLVEPVTLPKGTVVRVSGTFDNSVYNKANPDPNKNISFGLQSWDEMFIGYWSYTAAKPTNL
jgi:peroxiredoxin